LVTGQLSQKRLTLTTDLFNDDTSLITNGKINHYVRRENSFQKAGRENIVLVIDGRLNSIKV
jgi:hypothetical protein